MKKAVVSSVLSGVWNHFGQFSWRKLLKRREQRFLALVKVFQALLPALSFWKIHLSSHTITDVPVDSSFHKVTPRSHMVDEFKNAMSMRKFLRCLLFCNSFQRFFYRWPMPCPFFDVWFRSEIMLSISDSKAKVFVKNRLRLTCRHRPAEPAR
jgi:hypothetical protein